MSSEGSVGPGEIRFRVVADDQNAFPTPEGGDGDPEGETAANEADVVWVGVDRIQYRVTKNDGSHEWIDVPDPLYVLKDSDVTFRALPDPEDEEWPSGKPEWGGTSGAAGTGVETTVTFDEVGEYTVTAESGNEVEVDVFVMSFVGTHVADDDFQGRSASRYGVAEVVHLNFETEPQGTTAAELGGLQWEVVSGGGDLVNEPGNTGIGTYTGDGVAEAVTLRLVVQDGPNEGQESHVTFDVVQPNGGTCVLKPGFNVWHVQNTFSIGIATDFYLLPKDVSFSNVEFKEGPCPAQIDGWFVDANFNIQHQEWSEWLPVSGGNINTGSAIDFGDNYDYAWLYHSNPPPYRDGTFNWPIPWWYTTDGGATHHEIIIMDQSATVNGNGDATMEKGGADGQNNHADATAPWPWDPTQ